MCIFAPVSIATFDIVSSALSESQCKLDGANCISIKLFFACCSVKILNISNCSLIDRLKLSKYFFSVGRCFGGRRARQFSSES